MRGIAGSRRRTLLVLPMLFGVIITTICGVLGSGGIAAAGPRDTPAPRFLGVPPAAGRAKEFDLTGLQPGAVYDLGANLGTMDPTSVTASSGGSATTTYLLPGASTATSVRFSVTPDGTSTPVLEQTFSVAPPVVQVGDENDGCIDPWYRCVEILNWASGESVSLTYSGPLSGPSTLTTSTAAEGLGYDFVRGDTTYTPGPAPAVVGVSGTGGTYGRTDSTIALTLPGTELAAGATATASDVIDSVPVIESPLPAAGAPGFDLRLGTDGLLVEHWSDPQPEDAVPDVSDTWEARFSFTGQAVDVSVTRAGDLVVTDPSTGRQLWDTATAGTGDGSRLVMQGDGNLVLYAPVGGAIWSTLTGSLRTTLRAGQYLTPGEFLPDGSGKAVLQGDGNFVVYGTRTFSTRTNGTKPGRLIYQGDGNLVLYDAAGHAVWSTRTSGSTPGEVVLQSDGNLVMYDAAGHALWSSHTS